MTLVIAVATRPFAMLLSDRRITSATPKLSGGGWDYAFRDTDTKSIIMNGTHVLAFAGLGTVGRARQRMEFWIMDAFKDRLTPEGLSDWPDYLASEFGQLCEKIGYRCEHHFVAPGYFPDENGQLQPEVIHIDNDVYPNSFDVSRNRLEGNSAATCCIAGADVPADALEAWQGRMKELCAEPVLDLGLIIGCSLQLWAATAAVERTVGDTAICTSFPVGAVPLPAGATVDLSPPDPNLYLTSEVSVTYGLQQRNVTSMFVPARISSAGVMLGGMEVDFGVEADSIDDFMGRPLDRITGQCPK